MEPSHLVHLGRVAELEQNLILLYTGTGRLGSEISKNVTNKLFRLRSPELREMRGMVDEGLKALYLVMVPLDEFGTAAP